MGTLRCYSPMDRTAKTAHSAKILAFPARRIGHLARCPQCGTVTDTKRIGRLLWAYCETHEARWVARDFGDATREELRADAAGTLAVLARYAEIST